MEPDAKRICKDKLSLMWDRCKTNAVDTGRSAVCQHAAYFADDKGSLTRESMRDGHSLLGISSGVAFKSNAIHSLLNTNRCPFTPAAIASITNPARSGIWDANGHFNEAVFDELVGASGMNESKRRVVTRDMFDTLIAKHPDSGRLATWTWFYFIPVPLSWATITRASLDELFANFSDTTLNGKPGITVDRLRLFYTDPQHFFRTAKRLNLD